MFQSVNSVSEFNKKREDLIHSLELQASISKRKNARYKEAFDYDTLNTFALTSNAKPQTSNAKPQASNANPQTNIGDTPQLPQPPSRPPLSDSSTDNSTDKQSRLRYREMMRNEDYRSDLMRHRDAIDHNHQIIHQQNQEMNELRDNNTSLMDQMAQMTDYFNNVYHNAEHQFNELQHEHHLSIQQIQALHSDFELGRQLYLNIQTAHQTLQHERNITNQQLDDLQHDYAIGEELFINLRSAYKALQEGSDKRAMDYENIIESLNEVNAKATARVLELQSEMINNSVPASVAKNIRSRNNTVEALRKFLVENDKVEAPAATISSNVSKKILFVIKDGKLYKRQNGKPDIDLESGYQPLTTP
jgi:hypothetical protein